MEFLHEFLDARFVGAVKDFARAVQREGVQSTGPAAASTLYTPPQDVLASVMAATKALNITSTRISTDNLPAPASRAPSVPRKRPREGELHSPPSAKKRTDYDGHSSSFFDRSGHTRDFQVPSSRVGSSAYSLALSEFAFVLCLFHVPAPTLRIAQASIPKLPDNTPACCSAR